MGVIILLSKS